MDALCFIFSIDSDCDSDDDPAYIPDTDSDDTKHESSGTQHTTRKSVVKFGSALSTAGMLCLRWILFLAWRFRRKPEVLS